MLEIGLIKQIVSYIDETYPGKNITFNMTTNGTLLTDDIVDFLVRKNFILMLSIDGPKEVHDKQRRFITGVGSFDLIMKNLNRIKSRYPTYFSKILTNTVLNPDQEHNCVRDFFNADDLIGKLNHLLAKINDVGLTKPVLYDEALFIMEGEEICKVMLSMIGEIDASLVSPLYSPYKGQLVSKYAEMKLKGVKTKVAHPGGPCIPGVRRSFVDVDGNIYPCEKIIENLAFSIGNIYDGFDTKKVLDMLNVGKLTEDKCVNCWAFKRCTLCVARITDGDSISSKARISRCPDVMHEVAATLMDIAVLQHYGFDFERSIRVS